MKLAIFGVTGTVGEVLLTRALGDGHDVQALVRDPDRLTVRDDRLRIIAGDAVDPSAVRNTVSGTEAVFSTLGGPRGPESLSVGTAAITAAMTQEGVRRIVIAQGFHLYFRGDPRNLGQRVVRGVMRRMMPGINEHGTLMLEALQRSDLDWTVVRMCRVVSGAKPGGHSKGYRTGTLRLGMFSSVRDVDVVDFMLECLASGSHVHEAPMIVSR